MSILRDIQICIINGRESLANILLKAQFLASRLGSVPLEEWVRYEAKGYPDDVEVPKYRIAEVSYTGTWFGYGGSSIRDAPIPTYLINKYAGEEWTNYKIRGSIGVIEDLAKSEDGMLQINASNLILLLQDKVYKNYSCNSVSGIISSISFKEIMQSVRSRILELTIELEKKVPESIEVKLENPIPNKPKGENMVTKIFNQTIYGGMTQISTAGNANIHLSIVAGNKNSLTNELIKAGLPEDAAKEFSQVVTSEVPASVENALGNETLAWIKKSIPRAANEAWKIGSTVLTNVLSEAVLKFYGLKQ